MVSRIEIYTKVSDTRAQVKKKYLENVGFSGKISRLDYVDVYTIDKKLSKKQLVEIASRLTNPITQYAAISHSGKGSASSQNDAFSFAIEIGFLPGVTDNVAHTTKELIEDLLKVKFQEGEGVYSSVLYLISGKFSDKDASAISQELANPLIQRIHIKDKDQFKKDGGMDFKVAKVVLNQQVKVLGVDLNVSDEQLEKTGKEGVLDPKGGRRGPLALDLTYMKTIQTYFKKIGRNPTDIELESLAQTWSEHCKHTIFNNPLDGLKDGLFKTYIRGATDKIKNQKLKARLPDGQVKNKFLAKVFTDNSGAIVFDDKYLITHKVETHNTPSALDPFGGSITGIVGVNRDTIGFGLGAKPIFNTYGFCFADPQDEKPLYRGENKTLKMLPPRRIMEGVIAGVNSGGNQSGIPTPQGFLYFDERFKGKPLVFCGTIGLIPKRVGKKDSSLKKAQNGDYIVMVGGKVGIDGIHGATFSSEGLTALSPTSSVQIGDPITQKKFSDALIKEARDLNLYNSITDNGAGGLSSSVSEMARESGGCEVWLDKVPLKYPGLEPWQIWISESQERMTLAVAKNKWKKLQSLLKRRGVEAWVIGEFTNSGKCAVKFNDKTILDLQMDFLHEGLPKKVQNSKLKVKSYKEPKIKEPKDLTKTFIKMIGRLNICSFDFLSTQYDHSVQGLMVSYPVQGRGRVNSETTVVKPYLETSQGLVLSQGLFPAYSDIDSYAMAAASLDSAVKNVILAGADPERIALLDNFCWASSNEEESLYELKQAAKACYDYAVAYGAPFISGKDSMFNDFIGFDDRGKRVKISVPKTLLISSLGIIKDVKKALTIDLKFPGDLIYLLGETFEELGGSEYFAKLGYVGEKAPKVNSEKNYKLYTSFSKAAEKGLIASAIGVGRGGLGVALAKTAMAGMLGIEVSLDGIPGKVLRDDFALYSESQGRILVSINPKKKKKFEKVMRGNATKEIGRVTGSNRILIEGLRGNKIIETTIEHTLKSYHERFKEW